MLLQAFDNLVDLILFFELLLAADEEVFGLLLLVGQDVLLFVSVIACILTAALFLAGLAFVFVLFDDSALFEHQVSDLLTGTLVHGKTLFLGQVIRERQRVSLDVAVDLILDSICIIGVGYTLCRAILCVFWPRKELQKAFERLPLKDLIV